MTVHLSETWAKYAHTPHTTSVCVSSDHVVDEDAVLVARHADDHVAIVLEARAYRGHRLQPFRKAVHLQCNTTRQ